MRIHPWYQRYAIERRTAINIADHPHPFRVKINRFALLKLLVKELFKYRGNKRVITSRPCAYGVFSGPLGGFAPREKLCVGCLRCTTQYPEIATILPNPARKQLGDRTCTPEQVDTITAEAERGRLAVKGAGYRGKFGGEGWDGMWTDMSEIVRPTRDGIYGREYISTEVNLGERPSYLTFDEKKEVVGKVPRTVTLPIPLLFNTLPTATLEHPKIGSILSEAARHLRTFTILPFDYFPLKELQVIPLIQASQWEAFKKEKFAPHFLELEGWNQEVHTAIRTHLPNTQMILKIPFESDLRTPYEAGVRIFHLVANAQGVSTSGRFIIDLIREAHLFFIQQGTRDTVSLIGSGGINAAEHIPKAILCGLDAVALDTPLIVALQGKLQGNQAFKLPPSMTLPWGVQRLKNLVGAWQDQLIECAGAMGIREIRRMRGEIGRALFQKNLEQEAFLGIKGYEHR